jgi:hypothetical protein
MATSDTAIIEGKYISAWAESNRLGRQSVRLYNLIFLRKSQVVLRGQLLQYATEAFGRKSAPYTIWLTFVVVRILWAQAIQVTLTVKQSVLIESFAARWYHWLVAKLLGDGRWYAPMHNAIVSVRDCSNAAQRVLHQCIQLVRNSLSSISSPLIGDTNSNSWFVVGQLFASVALNRLAPRIHMISELPSTLKLV